MLLWLAIVGFGLILTYIIFDNRAMKRDSQRQLELVQQKIAEREQQARPKTENNTNEGSQSE